MHWVKLVAVNLVVLVALGLFGLTGLEIYLRATIPASSGGGLYESTTSTRRYKLMKPNTSIVAWGSEFRTNAMGFRDDDAEIPPKSEDRLRIVVLGDSFTASAGVDYRKIYTSLLEQELSEVSKVEVINLAVGGYNIIQYELVLEEVALDLRPDLILTAVFPFNDLSNETYRANYQDAIGAQRVTSRPAWYESLYVYRAYVSRAMARLGRLLGQRKGASSRHVEQTRTADANEADYNLAALGRIMDRSSAEGIRAFIALLPNTDGVEEQRQDFAPFISLCAYREWKCFNLLDDFAASQTDLRFLRLNILDPHPNERYNEMVASFLAQSLIPFMAEGAHSLQSAKLSVQP